MTAEIPQQTKGRCDDCGQTIGLTKKDLTGLVVECDCQSQSVRVADLTPESWVL